MPDRRMNPFKVYLQKSSVVDETIDGTALMETNFGIIVFGIESEDLDEWDEIGNNQALPAIEYNEEVQLDRLLERLWQQDQIPVAPKLTKEQQAVENHYLENFTRNATGRFTVRMPLKENIVCFGSPRDASLKRFMYLERKFRREPRIKTIYLEKVRELIRLGHMVHTEKDAVSFMQIHPDVPHHCIDKDDRIVYDAS